MRPFRCARRSRLSGDLSIDNSALVLTKKNLSLIKSQMANVELIYSACRHVATN